MRRAVFSRRSPPKAPYGENSRFAILIFVASVTVAMVALVAIFPRPVVLPAFSICALAAAACVALGIVALRVSGSEDGAVPAAGPAVLGSPVSQPVDTESPLEGAKHRLKLKEGTRKAVGQFTLRGGAKLRLDTADTTDGKSCLIDDVSDVGAGSACLETTRRAPSHAGACA